MSSVGARLRQLLVTAAGEPVQVATGIESLLLMLLGWGALDGIGLHSRADVVTVMAVVYALAAIWLAYRTHRTVLAPLIQLFKAAGLVLAMYHVMIHGHPVTLPSATDITLVWTILLGIWHSTQTSPLTAGTFAVPQVPPPPPPPTG